MHFHLKKICTECEKETDLFTVVFRGDAIKVCRHNFMEWMYTSNLYSKTKSRSNSKPSFRHYEVTLTCLPSTENKDIHIVKILKKFLTSKQFKPTEGWSACIEHISSNAHVHLSLRTTKYIPIKDLNKLNPARNSVTLLKGLARCKWDQYVIKTEPDKVIFNNLDDIDKYLGKE